MSILTMKPYQMKGENRFMEKNLNKGILFMS